MAKRRVTFDFDGESYSFTEDDITITAMELNDEGKHTLAVKAIVGDAQYAKFREHHDKASDLEKFLQAMFAAVQVGNR